MPFVVATGGAEISEAPSGIYLAKLSEKKEVENEYNGEKRKQFQLKYEITGDDDNDGEFIGDELMYWVNRNINKDGQDIVNPKSNMYKVLAAHEGADSLPMGFEGDLDEYIGTQCRIGVTRKPNMKGDVRPYITSFSPAPKKSRGKGV